MFVHDFRITSTSCFKNISSNLVDRYKHALQIFIRFLFFYRQKDSESDIDESLSSKELYIKKLISSIFDNLSIACNNVILKLVEDNIVIRVDIKFLTLNPCNDDWIQNNLTSMYLYS